MAHEFIRCNECGLGQHIYVRGQIDVLVADNGQTVRHPHTIFNCVKCHLMQLHATAPARSNKEILYRASLTEAQKQRALSQFCQQDRYHASIELPFSLN